MTRSLSRIAGAFDAHHKRYSVVVFVLAGILLLAHALSASVEKVGPDGEKYERMGWQAAQATSLMAPGNFGHAYWSPAWVTTIGAVYRVTGRNPRAIRILLTALALLTAWMTRSLALAVAGPRAAVIAPALLLFSTLFFRYTVYFQYEVALAFLITACGQGLLRSFDRTLWRNRVFALLAGLALGWAALISPRVLAFAPVLFVALARVEDRATALRRAALFAAGVLLVLAPWTVRNYRAFGEFIPTTSNGGINFYIGNNPHATGGYYLPPADQRPDHHFHESASWYREAFTYIAAHPGQTIVRTATKSVRFWNPHFGDQFIVLIAFVIGWVRMRRARPARSPLWVWVVAAPFTMMAVHAVFFYQPRYMIPVLPFICVVAAAGIAGWACTDARDDRDRNVSRYSPVGS